MTPFKISIPDHEYEAVLIVLPNLPDGTSIHEAADTLNMNNNHLRYIVDELILNGRLKKIAVDERQHHKRYKYERVE